ncbi:hypothetical protein CLAUR_032800 [Clostridium felsineum]|nr:hypothetical protein CLAUR_032800 [Clostridium felsineum]
MLFSKISKFNFFILTLIILVCFPPLNTFAFTITPLETNKELLQTEVEKIYNIRSSCLVSGDPTPLSESFDTKKKLGKYSLEHEAMRIKYLKDWSSARGIQFKSIKSFVRIKRIMPRGNSIRLALEESYKFDYIYKDDLEPKLNSFGVGIRHTTTLVKPNDKWLISSDWYTDCFEDALQSYATDAQPYLYKQNNAKPIIASMNYRAYDRLKAIAYADKYCGAAWGSSNDFKYNPKYMDFNGAGGDCTNFVSQALGDKEAGGLPQDGTWRCPMVKYGRATGSRAWSNADGLKNYLIYSGKGSVIKAGTFKELTEASSEPAISKLDFGDIVCYEKGRGNIDHFALVTSFDSHGYPLVNSHTTDRYHVPWDLGWGDKKIRFFLIKMH